jgi:hypothetical protein
VYDGDGGTSEERKTEMVRQDVKDRQKCTDSECQTEMVLQGVSVRLKWCYRT